MESGCGVTKPECYPLEATVGHIVRFSSVAGYEFTLVFRVAAKGIH